MGGRGAKLNRFESFFHNSNRTGNGVQYNVLPLQIDLSDYSEIRKAGMSDKQAQAVISIEEQVRYFKREHISIVDQEGLMVAENTGSESKVGLPSFRPRIGLAAIHNHPGEGGTFSPADIKANVKNKFDRLSVSTSRATYILRHTDHPGLVDYNSNRLANAYEKFHNSTRIKVKILLDRLKGRNDKEARNNVHRNWMKKNAAIFGFEYSEEMEP